MNDPQVPQRQFVATMQIIACALVLGCCFAAAAIVKPVEAAEHLRLLIDPRLLPARCHLFRRVVAAAVVPVGQSSEGLPIGVQIAARPFEDETVLGIASVVDAAFGYRAPGMARG